MNTPTNWNKTLWLAKRTGTNLDDFGNEVSTYDTPVKYEANYQTVNADSDIQMFGERATQIQKALFDKDKFKGVFKEFDLVYLDGSNPTNEKVNGDNANYRVQSIREQNLKIMVYFERLTSR